MQLESKGHKKIIEKSVGLFGTPSFIYFFDHILEKINLINREFNSRFKISYAVKANPNPSILSRLNGHIPFLDVSSIGEIKIALNSNWDSKYLSFTGPAKKNSDLSYAIENSIGEIVLESYEEAYRLDKLSLKYNIKQPVLIRLSPNNIPPGFGGHMAGRPCAFGIDEEDLDNLILKISKLKNIKIKGFHIFSGTQCLNSETIVSNWEIFIDIFKRATSISGVQPVKLIFGSGMGIPYFQNEKELSLPDVASKANNLVDKLKHEPKFSQTSMVLETGRYLIGEAGVYCTQVVNIKESRGKTICICDGGMNHNLAACGLLGMVIPKNYKISTLQPDHDSNKSRKYQIVGPLCTSLDTIGRDVELPEINIGDIICVFNSGAYGLTSSPFHFISHSPPKEILIDNSSGDTNYHNISVF